MKTLGFPDLFELGECHFFSANNNNAIHSIDLKNVRVDNVRFAATGMSSGTQIFFATGS